MIQTIEVVAVSALGHCFHLIFIFLTSLLTQINAGYLFSK